MTFHIPSIIETLKPLLLSTAGLVLKHTVTVWSTRKVVVWGGASASEKLLPQNFVLPLIGGLMASQSPSSTAGVWICNSNIYIWSVSHLTWQIITHIKTSKVQLQTFATSRCSDPALINISWVVGWIVGRHNLSWWGRYYNKQFNCFASPKAKPKSQKLCLGQTLTLFWFSTSSTRHPTNHDHTHFYRLN